MCPFFISFYGEVCKILGGTSEAAELKVPPWALHLNWKKLSSVGDGNDVPKIDGFTATEWCDPINSFGSLVVFWFASLTKDSKLWSELSSFFFFHRVRLSLTDRLGKINVVLVSCSECFEWLVFLDVLHGARHFLHWFPDVVAPPFQRSIITAISLCRIS